MKKLTILGLVVTILLSGSGCNSSSGSGADHVHSWANEWTANETEHWHACIEHGCTVKEDATPHVYDKKVVKASYLKSEATCINKAIYYKSCICGAQGTETFEYGKTLGHDVSTTYASDETGHWLICTRDGCGEQFGKSNHTGGTATESKRAVCEVCGAEYGEVLGKNGGDWSPWQPLD